MWASFGQKKILQKEYVGAKKWVKVSYYHSILQIHTYFKVFLFWRESEITSGGPNACYPCYVVLLSIFYLPPLNDGASWVDSTAFPHEMIKKDSMIWSILKNDVFQMNI